jgi:hypothetical protein
MLRTHVFRKGEEAVIKSLKEQKHFTQRRKAQEGAKKRKQLFFARLCALASLREIVHFFTASKPFAQRAAEPQGVVLDRRYSAVSHDA